MVNIGKFLVGAAAALTVTAFSESALAQTPIEFATFQPNSGADGQPGGIVWLRADDGGLPAGMDPSLAVPNSPLGGYLFTTAASLHAGATPVVPHTFGAMDTLFNFHNVAGVPTDAVNAGFLLQASSTAGATCSSSDCEDGDTVRQGGISGRFSFTYNGATPFIVNGHAYTTGANLLSGVFTGAAIVGSIGDTNGSFGAADRANKMVFTNVNFTSDIVQFSNPSVDQITLTIGAGAFPSLEVSAPGAGLTSYRSAGAGIFASNPIPMGPPGGAPEPASWALMIVGFAGAGFGLRSRRGKLAAV